MLEMEIKIKKLKERKAELENELSEIDDEIRKYERDVLLCVMGTSQQLSSKETAGKIVRRNLHRLKRGVTNDSNLR